MRLSTNVRCPFCQFRDSKVTDSRATDDGIRRRRQCISCGERFSTMEAVHLSTLLVVKKDGRREEFNREKLLAGLRRACEKRSVSVAQLEAVTLEIEARVAADGRPEVPSTFVGELAMDALRRLDHIAYIRFASVYRAFADIESLKEAVEALETGRTPTLEEKTLQLALPGDQPDALRPRLLHGADTRDLAESVV
ncbi:MAG: transcriptional regulator NrdR [Tepidiformaceae bacterium]